MQANQKIANTDTMFFQSLILHYIINYCRTLNDF
jgi:hypothetical protein